MSSLKYWWTLITEVVIFINYFTKFKKIYHLGMLEWEMLKKKKKSDSSHSETSSLDHLHLAKSPPSSSPARFWSSSKYKAPKPHKEDCKYVRPHCGGALRFHGLFKCLGYSCVGANADTRESNM